MPFNFDVVSKNGHNTPDKQSEEYKRSLLKSTHPVPARPLKGYKVTIEYWSSGTDLAGGIVAQVQKTNEEVFTVPLKLEGGVTSQECLGQVLKQVSHYLFWLSQWEYHLEGAAKAWNELEALINANS